MRGIAYATKGTFRLNDSIMVTNSMDVSEEYNNTNYPYDIIMLKMYYKNDTVIPTLDVADDDLTSEQKSYFDNYEQAREEYYQERNQHTLEDMEDT